MSDQSVFLYGTLRHLPLLKVVLGRLPDFETAILEDHQVTWADGKTFPVLSTQAGKQAVGLLATGLELHDIDRIDHYEAGYGYALSDTTVQTALGTINTQVYMPSADQPAGLKAWRLDEWVSHWGDLTCVAAEEVMAYQGRFSPQEIAQRSPVINARAHARLLAQETPPHPLNSHTAKADVAVTARRRPYSDFFAVDEIDLTHQRFDGTQSAEMTRGVFVGCDAVIMLPYDPVRDRVLLVEQFRAGPLVRGDQNPWSLEPIAGRIEAGQSPEQAARREAQEEARLSLTRLETVAGAYPSPSCMTEYYHLFAGICDLPDDVTGVAGLLDENEDIKSHLFGYDTLMSHVQAGRLTNAPLILLAYWLAYHRDRLRAEAA